MEENQELNSYELKKQQELKEQKILERKRTIRKATKTASMAVLIITSVVGLIWYVATRPPIPEEEIISKRGIHWHPELTILVKGEKQDISANIGLGAVHQPIHTHDTSGVLHLEIQGLVRKDDTKLGRFFKIWGKEFNSNCIFDNCNGPGYKVTMTINGKENTEFDNYEMKDKDKIEIKFE